jgi:hypothetical protein
VIGSTNEAARVANAAAKISAAMANGIQSTLRLTANTSLAQAQNPTIGRASVAGRAIHRCSTRKVHAERVGEGGRQEVRHGPEQPGQQAAAEAVHVGVRLVGQPGRAHQGVAKAEPDAAEQREGAEPAERAADMAVVLGAELECDAAQDQRHQHHRQRQVERRQ